MPVTSVTTTAADVFFGSDRLTSISFRNAASAGTIYLRNKQSRQNTVSSTDYDISLNSREAVGFSLALDGEGIIGPWQAISDAAGGRNLEILPIFKRAIRGT